MTSVSAAAFHRIHFLLTAFAFSFSLYLALLLHFDAVCKNEYHLEFWPSVSATIGDWFPEKSFFTWAMCLAMGSRFVAIIIQYQSVQAYVSGKSFWLALLVNVVSALSLLRVLVAMGWMYVSSTQFMTFHVTCTVLYLVLAMAYMILHLIMSRQLYSRSSGPTRNDLKLYCVIGCSLSLIFAAALFYQHKVLAVYGAYSLYAMCEWSFVFFDLSFEYVCSFDVSGLTVSLHLPSVGTSSSANSSDSHTTNPTPPNANSFSKIRGAKGRILRSLVLGFMTAGSFSNHTNFLVATVASRTFSNTSIYIFAALLPCLVSSLLLATRHMSLDSHSELFLTVSFIGASSVIATSATAGLILSSFSVAVLFAVLACSLVSSRRPCALQISTLAIGALAKISTLSPAGGSVGGGFTPFVPDAFSVVAFVAVWLWVVLSAGLADARFIDWLLASRGLMRSNSSTSPSRGITVSLKESVALSVAVALGVFLVCSRTASGGNSAPSVFPFYSVQIVVGVIQIFLFFSMTHRRPPPLVSGFALAALVHFVDLDAQTVLTDAVVSAILIYLWFAGLALAGRHAAQGETGGNRRSGVGIVVALVLVEAWCGYGRSEVGKHGSAAVFVVALGLVVITWALKSTSVSPPSPILP